MSGTTRIPALQGGDGRQPDQDVNVVLLANSQGHEEEPLAAIHRQLTAG